MNDYQVIITYGELWGNGIAGKECFRGCYGTLLTASQAINMYAMEGDTVEVYKRDTTDNWIKLMEFIEK